MLIQHHREQLKLLFPCDPNDFIEASPEWHTSARTNIGNPRLDSTFYNNSQNASSQYGPLVPGQASGKEKYAEQTANQLGLR